MGMNEYLILSVGAASAFYFFGVVAIFLVVYALGLWIEWRRRK